MRLTTRTYIDPADEVNAAGDGTPVTTESWERILYNVPEIGLSPIQATELLLPSAVILTDLRNQIAEIDPQTSEQDDGVSDIALFVERYLSYCRAPWYFEDATISPTLLYRGVYNYETYARTIYDLCFKPRGSKHVSIDQLLLNVPSSKALLFTDWLISYDEDRLWSVPNFPVYGEMGSPSNKQLFSGLYSQDEYTRQTCENIIVSSFLASFYRDIARSSIGGVPRLFMALAYKGGAISFDKANNIFTGLYAQVAACENGNGSHQIYGLSEYDILNALKFAGIIDFDINDEEQVRVSFTQDAMWLINPVKFFMHHWAWQDDLGEREIDYIHKLVG